MALVLCFRNGAVGKAEVTITEAVLHIADGIGAVDITGRTEVGMAVVVLRRLQRQCVVAANGEVAVLSLAVACTYALVAIALVEVEVVQVVGHLAVIEGVVDHLYGIAATGIVECFVLVGVVAVDNLVATAGRIAEDSLWLGDGVSSGGTAPYPAVLNIASTGIDYTGTGKRACHAEVIDFAAELVEQRVVQAADGMAVAMQNALEAGFTARGYRSPFIGNGRIISMAEVCTQEELETLAGSDARIELDMVPQGGVAGSADSRDGVACQGVAVAGCIHKTQIVEVLEQLETVLAYIVVVIDIDLRLALHVFVVDVHVVRLVLIRHYLSKIVVVGHTHGHVIRIGATGIALSVVGHIIAILIPVERMVVRLVVNTIGVALGIALCLEQLPATASDLIGSRHDGRLAEAGEVARQDDVGLRDVAHNGHAALER